MLLTTEKMLHVKIVNLTTRPKLISKYEIKIAQISSTLLIYEDAEFKDIRQRLGSKGKHPPSPTQNIREKVGHDEQKQEKQAIIYFHCHNRGKLCISARLNYQINKNIAATENLNFIQSML